MNLRRQLLLVSLLTLVLPWAGCQFIRETESALREGQENMLDGTAQAIADSLSQFPADFLESGTDGVFRGSQIYAHPLAAAPLIDGYRDDWSVDEESIRTMRGVGGETRFVFGATVPHLYLVVEVRDTDIVYAEPGNTDGADRVELVSVDVNGRLQRFVFAPEAPGALVGRLQSDDASVSDSRLQGHWSTTAFGYRVEARIPRPLLGSYVGLVVWSADSGRGRAIPSASYGDDSPGRLLTVSPVLASAIEPYAQDDLRLIVTDRTGWRLAMAGRLSSSSAPAAAQSGWMRFAYNAVLEPGGEAPFAEPSPSGRERQAYVSAALEGRSARDWFRSADTGRAVVAVAKPVFSGSVQTGAVILQQGTDAILSLTNTALGRLLNFTMIATLAAAGGLLGYASWLSWRIRRLSAAAERAVDDDTFVSTLPSAASHDEIGDLSRRFSDVLRQLQDYNEYLRTLASKLSHELRTPLTIVNSSLENLEHEALSETAAQYTGRARDGVLRLRKILDAMSEANRVEALMQNVEPEPFDLVPAIEAAVSGYRGAWSEREFGFSTALDSAIVSGSPELVVQLLDKLIDNAVSFTATGDTITIGLEATDAAYRLSVTNPGPPLPAKLRGQLFDSMVSVRANDADEHLGLGLHIARIVAEGHGGRISASDGDGGVTFAVRLPSAGR